MSQYWIANVPGSTVTSSEAERVAVAGRTAASTITAANVAALGGTAVAIPIKVSTGLGAVTHFMDITVASSSRNMVCTALASSNGVTVNIANNVGYLRIKTRGSTGDELNRYILLFSS